MNFLYLICFILVVFNLFILVYHFNERKKEYDYFIEVLHNNNCSVFEIKKGVFKSKNLYIDKNYIYYKNQKIKHLNNATYLRSFIKVFNI